MTVKRVPLIARIPQAVLRGSSHPAMRVPVRVQELRVPVARLPRLADAVDLELEMEAAKVSDRVASAAAIARVIAARG